MKSKSGRTSPVASATSNARATRLIVVLLCLVAVVAGAMQLRKAGAERRDDAVQTAPQTTASATKAEPAAPASTGEATANSSGQEQAAAKKAVAQPTAKAQAKSRAAEALKRARTLRQQEAKEAAVKLMLQGPLTPSRLEVVPALALKVTEEEREEKEEAERERSESGDRPATVASEAAGDSKNRPQPAASAIPSKATPAAGAVPKVAGQDLSATGAAQTQTTTPDAPVVEPGRPQVSIIKGKSAVFDMRDLPQTKMEPQERPEHELPFNPRLIEPAAGVGKESATPTPQTVPITPGPPAPAPTITFEGLDRAGGWGNGFPPDTNGDVGPNHYIQTINTSLGIYNKSTGARISAVTFNTFMSQGNFGNLCDTNNFGDPVVLYDSFENRWVITDFAFQQDALGDVINPPGAFQCIAVSKTADPVAGGWNFYSINTTGGLGDYPKLGIWPDGLYMTVNMFGYAGGFQNARVYAFNKAQMYAGAPSAQVVSFNVGGGDGTILPANARLQTGTPPAGSPNYFLSTSLFLNALAVYKFHVDWDRISLTTFTGPETPLAATSWPNAAAPNATTPANNLDTLGTRAMMQNQYTNIGGVESLWTTHTVRRADTAGNAAPRWYQVNVTGGTVAANLPQATTWDPDGANTTHRYIPSVALDRAGNLALGYTTSNSTTNPGMKYAGRLAGDPINTFSQTEQTLIQGTGSQSGNCGGAPCTRWGDYSAMTLDPDGCTFWFTSEYYAATGLNFQTRIGSFKYPSCTPVGNGGTVSGTVTATVGGLPLNGVTVSLGSRTATTNVTGAYSFTSIPAGTYPSITASQPGFNTGTNTPVVVSDATTTTKNFSLTAAPASACATDTSRSDFQTGVLSNLDPDTTPGDVTLLNTATIDQQNTTLGNQGAGFTTTAWLAQTFTPAATGQLTRVDVNFFSLNCASVTMPNITVSIRNASGDLPTGSDLAAATIAGFCNGGGGFFTANFASPATLTAGTQYAIVWRAAAAIPGGSPAPGYFGTVSTGTGSIALQNPYAGGRRASSANSGSTWAGATGNANNDHGFIAYMKTGFIAAGDLTSSTKDANPATGFTTGWGNLTWAASVPANTALRFQAAASNNVFGPFNFVGPDGTAATFFTTSGSSLSQFDGKRYLKYKAFLTTNSSSVTPTLQDVAACYTNTQIPTAAKLSSFTATPTRDGRVLLQWRTGTEVDNLGFNVYREVDGVRTRITPQLVAGSALMAGADIAMTSGNAYAWADAPPAGKSVRYFLEDVDLNGKRTVNGPYSLSAGNAEAVPQQATLLTQLGYRQAQLSFTGGSAQAERSAQPRASAALQSPQPFALAGLPAIKLSVTREGWYRINQSDLVAAGLDPNVNPRYLQLFVDGREVPLAIQSSQSGKFDSASSIGFYGVGLDSASSDSHVYWLAAGTQPGLRIEKVQPKGEVTGAASFPYTVERKDRSVYFAALRNGDAENFFGAVIAGGPVDQSLTLQRVNKATAASAQLEVALQGVTQQPHQVKVLLNGTQVGSVNFSGQSRGLLSLPVPHSLLNEGDNVVRFVAQSAETDISLVDSIRITYQHAFKAEGNALRLTANAAERVTVDGFTSGDIRVFDVTDAERPQEVAAVVQGQKTGYAVTAGVPGGGPRVLLALSGARAQQPTSIKANTPSSLRQTANGADLVIIAHRSFAASTASLVSLRQRQGLSVAVVDVEDVYDEFSYGNKTPQAIKDFLAYARGNWQQAPQYALLVGDASLDPKNYLGFGDSDYVPTRLIETLNMETASDDWMADFSGSGVADIAIGRLPARTAQEAAAMVGKIVSYDAAAPKQSVLLVADRNDSYDFTSTDAALREIIPAGVNVDEVNRNVADDATARSQMFAAINSGQKIVNYAGHGSVDSWRGQLLTNADAQAMTNSSLPLFITMTCLNGYYQDPAVEGLAESLMRAGRGGAVAVWASSGMTVPGSQAVMNQEMYRLVFDGSLRLTLGEATRRAKALVNDADVRRTWILFGDPTMRLK